MIAVINSGVANLASVMAALSRLNAEAIVTDDIKIIAKADKVILPGVGAASAAMASLRQKELVETLRNLTRPVLGICLGMQLLFDQSSEGEGEVCLGIISGEVGLLPSSPEHPVPHIGWNQLSFCKSENALLEGVEEDSYVYFVHSFAVPVSDFTVAKTKHGSDFSAIVAKNNFFGCQFHPERSGAVGSRILSNFMGL